MENEEGTPATFYSEDQVSAEFKEQFDQPNEEGDVRDVRPYRFLTDWYLVDSKDESGKRIALPESFHFKATHVFYGTLMPNAVAFDLAQPLSLRISSPQSWCIDLHTERRGFWVGTPSAWYQLQFPNTMEPSPKLPSQYSLQLQLRAELALLSNLLDIFPECNDPSQYSQHYRPLLKYSPQDVHKALSCTGDDLYKKAQAQYEKNSLSSEIRVPFDLELLQYCADHIYAHLQDHPILKGTVFLKKFKSMGTAAKRQRKGKHKYSREKYEQSAINSEERAQRTAYGSLLKNPRPYRPYWALEFKEKMGIDALERPATEIAVEKPSKRRREERSGETSQTKKRRIIDEEDEDENKKEEEAEETPMQVEKTPVVEERPLYSSERMLKALEQCKDWLKPKPSGDGSWIDVVSQQYAIASAEKANEVLLFIHHNENLTWELKLLIISSFRNAIDDTKVGKKIRRCLFMQKVNGTKLAACVAKVFCVDWRESAGEQVKKYPKEEQLERAVGWYVLEALANLIADFPVKKEQLDIMEEKVGFDWGGVPAKLVDAGRNGQDNSLIKAAMKAREHIENILEKDGGTSNEQQPKENKKASTDATKTQNRTIEGADEKGRVSTQSSTPQAEDAAAEAKKKSASALRKEKMLKKKKFSLGTLMPKKEVPVTTVPPSNTASAPLSTGSENSAPKSNAIQVQQAPPTSLPTKATNSISSSAGASVPKEAPSQKPKSKQGTWPLDLPKDDYVPKVLPHFGIRDWSSIDGGRPELYTRPSSGTRAPIQSRPSNAPRAGHYEPAAHRAGGPSQTANRSDLERGRGTTLPAEQRRPQARPDTRTGASTTGHPVDSRRTSSRTEAPMPSHQQPSNQYQSGRQDTMRNSERGPAPSRSVVPSQANDPRGAGRGRAKNLPAWMTRGEHPPPDGPNTSASSGPTDVSRGTSSSIPSQQASRGYPEPRNEPAPSRSVVPPLANDSRGGGAGRGRAKNLPAWMTRGEHPPPDGPTTSAAPPASAPSRPVVPPPANESRGGGAGRGRAKNMPAWMTRGEHPPPSGGQTTSAAPPGGANPVVSNPQANYQGGRGRGAGRGKNQTLPAWMTRNGGPGA